MNDVAINTAATFSSRTALTLEAAQKLLDRCQNLRPHVNFDLHRTTEEIIDIMECIQQNHRNSRYFVGHIYFLTYDGDERHCKAGKAGRFNDGRPGERIGPYRTHNPLPIKVLALIPIYGSNENLKRYEERIHALLKLSRRPNKREWYNYTDHVDHILKIVLQYLDFTEYTVL